MEEENSLADYFIRAEGDFSKCRTSTLALLKKWSKAFALIFPHVNGSQKSSPKEEETFSNPKALGKTKSCPENWNQKKFSKSFLIEQKLKALTSGMMSSVNTEHLGQQK